MKITIETQNGTTITDAELIFDVDAVTYERNGETYISKLNNVSIDYLDLGGAKLNREQLVGMTCETQVNVWEVMEWELLEGDM